MIIRKLNNNNNKWHKFILAMIIIIGIFLIYRGYGNLVNFKKSNFGGNNYTEIKGIIEKISKIGYDEYFLKIDKEKILLKDYPKNIDNIIGNNIIIKGEMGKDKNSQTFFIKVLKDLDNNIIIENNVYTFIDELFLLNAKEIPGIISYKQGNRIFIYYKSNPMIDISAFGCSKVSSARNCKDLIDTFDLNENEYFNSYNGLSYYKVHDNKWEVFNDNFLGYYIETKDDDTLLNLSSIINIINSNYLLNKKKDLITSYCKDLLNIENINIMGNEGNILTINVKGKNKEKFKSECKIRFDLMNERNIMKD